MRFQLESILCVRIGLVLEAGETQRQGVLVLGAAEFPLVFSLLAVLEVEYHQAHSVRIAVKVRERNLSHFSFVYRNLLVDKHLLILSKESHLGINLTAFLCYAGPDGFPGGKRSRRSVKEVQNALRKLLLPFREIEDGIPPLAFHRLAFAVHGLNRGVKEVYAGGGQIHAQGFSGRKRAFQKALPFPGGQFIRNRYGHFLPAAVYSLQDYLEALSGNNLLAAGQDGIFRTQVLEEIGLYGIREACFHLQPGTNPVASGKLQRLPGGIRHSHPGIVISPFIGREGEEEAAVGPQGGFLFQHHFSETGHRNGHPGAGKAVAGIAGYYAAHRHFATFQIEFRKGVEG